MLNKLVITSPSVTIQDNHIRGGVNCQQVVNAAQDLSVGDVCSAQLSFTTDISTLTENSVIVYYVKQNNDSNYRQIGVFYVDKITQNNSLYTVTAYDIIKKLDVDVSSYLADIGEVTLYDLFCYICDYVLGPDKYYNNSLPTNSDVWVNTLNLYSANSITARTVLSYIAALSGSFICATNNDLVKCTTFTNNNINILGNKHCKLNIASKPAPAIGSIYCTNDSGKHGVGSGVELDLGINPLLNGLSNSEVTEVLRNILSAISYGEYYAATFNMYEDYGVKAGDIVRVDGKKVLIFEKLMSATGCHLSCTGEPERQQVQNNSTQINNIQNMLITNGLNNDTLRANEFQFRRQVYYNLSKLSDILSDIDARLLALEHPTTIYHNVSVIQKCNGLTGNYGTITGTGQVADGSFTTLLAIANENYLFDHWEYPQGTIVSRSGAYSTPAITEDRVYYAVFTAGVRYHNLTIVNEDTSINGGYITVNGETKSAGTYTIREAEYELEAHPYAGYHLATWYTSDGHRPSNPDTFNIVADLTIYYCFEADAPSTYTVTLNSNYPNCEWWEDSVGGTSINSFTVAAGESKTLFFGGDTDCEYTSFDTTSGAAAYIEDVSYTYSDGIGEHRVLIEPQGNCTITAEQFEP